MVYNGGMTYVLLKYLLSAALIVAVSEVAKRSAVFGGLIASLPMVSILALIWVYLETKNTQTVSALSYSILWFVLPSLVLFVVLPLLLKRGMSFYAALALASLCTVIAYTGFTFLLQKGSSGG